MHKYIQLSVDFHHHSTSDKNYNFIFMRSGGNLTFFLIMSHCKL